MDGGGAGFEGGGEAVVHEDFVVVPGGVVAVGAGHRGGGGFRQDGVPLGVVAGPDGVEGGDTAVAQAEPGAEGGECGWGAIEVPGGGEVGDAGLVAEGEIERAVGGMGADVVGQAIGDAGEPGGVGEAGAALVDGEVGGVALVAGLGFEEAPVDLVGVFLGPHVVGRVEVGGDVFDVPLEIALDVGGDAGGDVGGGEGGAVAEDLHGGDADGAQAGVAGGGVVGVADDLELVPGASGRAGDENGGGFG